MHVAQGQTHSCQGQSHALLQTATDTGDYALPSLPAYRSHFQTQRPTADKLIGQTIWAPTKDRQATNADHLPSILVRTKTVNITIIPRSQSPSTRIVHQFCSIKMIKNSHETLLQNLRHVHSAPAKCKTK